MRTKTILLGLLFCLTLSAQGVIDEVIWVVGDEAILRSEVEEERLRALYEGTPIPGDPIVISRSRWPSKNSSCTKQLWTPWRRMSPA